MKLLLIDIDTLRADHLGCYGYDRATSPAIDSIAADGVCFRDYYCSDAPCLPSRAALFSSRFCFHNGVINHGGLRADPFPEGATRGFKDKAATNSLPAMMRTYGMYTASISTFPERHSAWWFNAGFNEMYNVGKSGDETADEVTPIALDWLDRNRSREDWFLHVHYWDPHTEYRAPAELGNPFAGQPSEGLSWIDEEVFRKHRQAVGFHTAQELNMYGESVSEAHRLRQLGKLESLDDVRHNMDGYDCGILYADMAVGQIIQRLKELGIYEETAIIVTSDHGEAMGELGRYSEHGTADQSVTRIPLVIKWPGALTGGRILSGLHYNIDLLPTLIALLGDDPAAIPYGQYLQAQYGVDYKKVYLQMILESYDGKSFAESILSGSEDGRDHLVVSMATHSVQRAVRFGDYLYIRTYHDAYALFPDDMLFNIKEDPHEQHDLAEELPDKVHEGACILEKWITEQMRINAPLGLGDPIWTVLGEGGGFHSLGAMPGYLDRLEKTGRSEQAQALLEKYPQYKDKR